MVRQRLLSAALLAVPFVLALALGGLWVVVITYALAAVSLMEYVHLIARRGHRAFGGLMLLWMLVFVIDRSQPDYPYTDAAIAALLGIVSLILVLAGWFLLRRSRDHTHSA